MADDKQVGSTVEPCPLKADHWVEIELLGEDGKGIADELVHVAGSEGVEGSTKTDARGIARIDGLHGGQCLISFPNLDQDAWEPAAAKG